MKKVDLLAAIAISMSLITPALSQSNEKSDTFFSLGLGLVQEDLLAKPGDFPPANQLTPSMSIGLGISQQISDNWQLENRLSLEHLQTNLTFSDNEVNANNETYRLNNTGLWLSSALKYTALHQDMRPFVQLDVGKVYAEFQGPEGNDYGLETGYRAGIGMEFDMEKGSSLSFAVMAGDTNSLN